MSNSPTLPSFSNPPLDEVVLGVQFAPCPGYSSVHASDIWKLYKKEFPNVREHHALEPQYEIFGGPRQQEAPRFKLGRPPTRGRLWFLSKEQNHLIQFQDDKLLLNWRRHTNNGEYPRFESILEDFSKYFSQLSQYFILAFDHSLLINQAEISYINVIRVDSASEISNWINLWNLDQLKIEAINTNFTEVAQNQQGKAFARLHHEINSVSLKDREQSALRYAMTFRGKPTGDGIDTAVEFLQSGRKEIVNRFNDTTTKAAHAKWGKIK